MMFPVVIKDHERGLMFRHENFAGILKPGRHWCPGVRIERVSVRDTWLTHSELDVIAKSHWLPDDLRVIRVQEHERAFVWIDGRLDRVLKPGLYAAWTALKHVHVRVNDMRHAVCDGPVCSNRELEDVVRNFELADEARILDLKDHERALVWINGRFVRALNPGLHVLWTALHEVRTEIVDARNVRFEHPELKAMLQSPGIEDALTVFHVEQNHVGLWFLDGEFKGELAPGAYAYWSGVGRLHFEHVEMRERALEVAGQEIMTHDKVTLRLNAVATWRVSDALKTSTVVEDVGQALYREAQLAVRAIIGARELDALLAAKHEVADELFRAVAEKAGAFGVEVLSLGIKDIVLPGEMRDLMNKVTEARKAAEASLITRREETAAARMQANTAKLLENNPTLMKLRELEVLEKVAEKANLTVMLGENGLSDRVLKLL
jgi:regulator of protease activity HflC (stomatin/prohibitin superfamily)